jgi:hypothetical protein
MKTLLRTLLYLSLMVWVGAEIFFPVVAAITFITLQPDTHTAGRIVGELLRILHGMGIVSGMVTLALLALFPAWGIYKPRAVLVPMALVLLMIGCTIYSQFAIIPAMERDRIAVGGIIDAADAANPSRIGFNKLHSRSEHVEEAILLLGLATVVLVAKAEAA